MGRRQDSDYIEPRTITVVEGGITYQGKLHVSRAGPNRYQYSVSYGGEWRTNSEDLMPSTWHCEEHGKRDLLSMVRAKKGKEAGTLPSTP